VRRGERAAGRRLLLLLLPLLLLWAVLLPGASPAAAAVAAGTVAVDPGTARSHGTVTVRGALDWSDGTQAPFGRAQLRTAVPGHDAPVEVATAPDGDPRVVSWSLTTAPCGPAVPAVCGGAAVLPNGARSVQLWEVQRLLGAPDRQVADGSVLVDVPAGQPQDVAAAIDGRTVTVTWARAGGPGRSLVEPDVRWEVSDGQGRTTTVAPGPDTCRDGVCRAVLDYSADQSGPRSFTVAASRPCDGCQAASTVSDATAEVVVPAVAAVPTTRTPPPSGAPGPTGGAGRASLPGGFGALGPTLGAPGSPSSRGGAPPAVAAAPLPDTIDDTLGYGDQVVEVAPEADTAQVSGREQTRLTTTGGLLGDEQLLRSIAGALVLVLGGAHLRTWLARARDDAPEA
jgi:hypothetical protein